MPCLPGVGRRRSAGRWLASNLRYWVWDGMANPYRSYSSAEQLAKKGPRRCRRGYRLLIWRY